jgi:hypothetical protein
MILRLSVSFLFFMSPSLILAQEPPITKMGGGGLPSNPAMTAPVPVGGLPAAPTAGTPTAGASSEADPTALPLVPTAFAGIIAILALLITCYPFQKDETNYEDD